MPEMTDYYMSNAEYEYRYNPSVTKSVAHSVETDLEDACKLLQAQIAGLRNAPLTIRRRGVPLPAIHHLPEELLCFIFRYLMSEDRPSGKDGLGWINATHVCRYWRMVALSNPTLWWCLNFNLGRQWATAVLARSQALPLEITLTVLSGEEYEYADYLVRKCLKRAISLFVVVPQALPGRLDGMLIGPAPLLESFELSYDIENVNPLPILPDTTPYTLPATFLDHANCPRLESISLSRCTIPLGAPLNLTALALHNLVADDILPIFQLLPQLQRLSALIVQFHRSVDLHGEVNLHGEVEKWDTIYLSLKPITMPHLANFHLKGRNPECSMVIGNLIAPRLSQLFMKCTITTGCLEEFAEVNDALEDFIERSGVTAKDQAGVSASVSGADVNPGDDRTCKLEVYSWSTPEHACASSSKVSNGLSVEFSWPDESVPPLLRLAGDVCHAARLGDVHTLDLDLEENLFNADVLEDTISLVQRLESLRFLSVDGLTDNDEDDVLVLLSGKDYLRSYEYDTMEGYHYEVVRSAVPRAYEPSDTPTTPVPMSPSNDGTDDPSSSPLP